mgnify:CR=1 FL=1
MKDETVFVPELLEKINRLWNNGEIAVAEDIADREFVRHMPSAPDVVGLEGLVEDVLNLRELFPDLIITFEENIFDGKTMAMHWHLRGTDLGRHPQFGTEPTGKKIDHRGVDILHFKEGKIAESFAYFDRVTIMQQLGLMPEMG